MNIPYTSHNGFFSEFYNDIRHKNRITGSRQEKAKKILFTGHLQHLKSIKCFKDAKHLEEITNAFKEKAGAHYCLPDNIFEIIDEEEVGGDIEIFAPFEYFTISYVGKSKKMLLFCLRENNYITVYPCNIGTLQEGARGIIEFQANIGTKELQKLKEVALALPLGNDEKSSVADFVSWVACSHCVRIFDDGKIDSHYWLEERRGIDPSHEKQWKKSINEVVAHMCAFFYLFNRPAEEIQYEYEADPDWKENPITKRDRKKGKLQEQKPTKVRLYLPKRKHVGVNQEESERTQQQQQHKRSGHYRHYKNGRKIWIDSYIAGNPELGTKVHQPKTIEIVPRRNV